MVEYIAWDDKYKIGHQIIDSQHQHLFKLADRLHVFVESGTGTNNEELEQVILECAEYVLTHFTDEEQIMEEIGYAEIERHRKLHLDFNIYISGIVGDFTSGKEINVGSLYAFLTDWLVKHIILEDKKIADAIGQMA